MPPPTAATPPLEYALYYIYRGEFKPPKNFVDVPLKDCDSPTKVLSKRLIKSLAGPINKFIKQYQQLHDGTKPRLYNICYIITHQAAVYKSEEYKQFVRNQPFKAFKPPEAYSDSDDEQATS